MDKPFVLSTIDAVHLVEVAERRQLIGAVAFTRRLDHAYRFARDTIRSGRLGEVQHIDTTQLGYPTHGWYGKSDLGGGGPFIGRGSHVADTIPWLINRPIELVSASFSQGSGSYGPHAGGFIHAVSGNVSWRATILTLPTWTNSWLFDEIRVFGEDGYVTIRRPPDDPSSWLAEQRDLCDQLVASPPVGKASHAIDDFIDAILGSTPPSCTFREAVPSVTIIEAACAAATQDGRIVSVRSPKRGIEDR